MAIKEQQEGSFFFFFGHAAQHGMQDLSSPSRSQT